jgi:hypothetical protein
MKATVALRLSQASSLFLCTKKVTLHHSGLISLTLQANYPPVFFLTSYMRPHRQGDGSTAP